MDLTRLQEIMVRTLLWKTHFPRQRHELNAGLPHPSIAGDLTAEGFVERRFPSAAPVCVFWICTADALSMFSGPDTSRNVSKKKKLLLSWGLRLKRNSALCNSVKSWGILCMQRGQVENFILKVLGWLLKRPYNLAENLLGRMLGIFLMSTASFWNPLEAVALLHCRASPPVSSNPCEVDHLTLPPNENR